jgi:prophage tail gpP-like protein
MEPWMIILIVAVAATVVAIMAWVITDRNRSRHLKEQFGPEYNWAITEAGNRRQAESQLARREIRAKQIREQRLSLADRDRFLSEWKLTQAQFVDDPSGAVERADELLAEIMRTRGYSTGNLHERMADIAAAYPLHADHYREAGKILERHTRGETSTDELRTAFLHYRTIFDDLLGGYDEEYRRVS